MNKLKEIRFTIKKTEYCEVVISKENGWDIPDKIGDIVDKVIEIKNDPENFTTHDTFCGEEYEIINEIEFIEGEK